MSMSNHLKNLLKRKWSRRMIKKTTSSNRKRMKKMMKWNRRKTTSTRIAHQVTISRATSLISKRKKLFRLLFFNVASYQSRSLIRNLRLIFDEVRDVRRKHCSKRETIDFQRRRKRWIVVQTLSSLRILIDFCFLYDKINNDYVFFAKILMNEKFFIWLFVFFLFARQILETNQTHSCSFLLFIRCIFLINFFI
jgi:hypothetical protein